MPAQGQTYPTRPVTMVVPFPAGGSTDWLSRVLGQKLEQRLKQPFIIENCSGGSTLIAASAVAKSEPDGHTLLMTTSTTMAINVSVFKSLPYDPAKDFAPVALVSGVPFILVVNPSLPVTSAADLVQVAKSRPGGLDYVSTGPGSAANLYAVLLSNALGGITMTAIPYKGASQGLMDLIGGHIDFSAQTVSSAASYMRGGTLIALASTAEERLPEYPDLPTLKELGYPELVATTWFSISAPAKLPRDIAEKVNHEMMRTMALPAVQQQMQRDGLLTKNMTIDEFGKFIAFETTRWKPVIERAGLVGVKLD